MSEIVISHVITVFNKADALPNTIASLKNQAGDYLRELVFVDDCSTDNSLEIIRTHTADFPRVKIIENRKNLGPSIRMNQGVKAAEGSYVHLFDADDIFPQNAAKYMVAALMNESAGFIYGKWEKTHLSAEALVGRTLDATLPCYSSATPLKTVLAGRFVRMCVMAERAIYLKAGGADPRIFVQDESLPLRLANTAGKMLYTEATVSLVPRHARGLSRMHQQAEHDRFMAYYLFLCDQTNIPASLTTPLMNKAYSAYWKYVRRQSSLAYMQPVFIRYVLAKTGIQSITRAHLDACYAYFLHAKNVRRVNAALIA